MSQATPTSDQCTNCGAPVLGKYCVDCGQTTRNVRLSVHALFTEFVDTYFNLNSKLVNSFVPMFRNPGFLTLAFIEGRRAAYLPPVRLYLVSSVIFFLSFAYVTRDADPENVVIDKGDGVQVLTDDGFKPVEEVEQQGGKSVSVGTVSATLEGLPKPPDQMTSEDWRNYGNQYANQSWKKKEKKEKKDIPASSEKRPDQTWAEWFEQEMNRRGEKLDGMDKAEIMATLVPQMFTMTSRALFLLMPLFALFLKFLYIRRDPLYIDHLIFAFHYHSFLFIFLTGLIFWNIFMPINLSRITTLAIFFVPPFYLYKSLRCVYQQSRLRTMIKFGILWFGYVIMLLAVVTTATILAFWYF